MDTQPGSIFRIKRDSLGLFMNIEGSIYRTRLLDTQAMEEDRVVFIRYEMEGAVIKGVGWTGSEWWYPAAE